MKFSCFLFAFISFPATIFSQPTIKKDTEQEVIHYYLKKTDLSRSFVNSYISLISGRQGYAKKDTSQANKLIKKLYRSDKVVFYRLMRIKLEWEFKQHLMLSSLDSVRYVLKDNIDSACYYHMLANYFNDKMDSARARRPGFVTVDYKGEEQVDWGKIKNFNWHDPRLIETIGIHSWDSEPGPFYTSSLIDKRLRDSSLSYYNKAIRLDSSEFFYLRELIIFLSSLKQETTIQETIGSKMLSYNGKKRRWLLKQLGDSYLREKRN